VSEIQLSLLPSVDLIGFNGAHPSFSDLMHFGSLFIKDFLVAFDYNFGETGRCLKIPYCIMFAVE